MKHKYLIILALLTLFVNACRKQIEIEFPEHQPLIVANCLFTADSALVVKVEKSSGFNDSTSYNITNATCKFFANNQFVENLTHASGGYYVSPSNYKPVVGSTYRIEISADGLPSVWATGEVPQSANITNITKIDSVMFSEYGEYLHQLELTINDPEQIENFYEISIFAYYKLDYTHAWWIDSTEISEQDTAFRTNVLVPQSQDIVLQNEGLFAYYPRSLPFSDELFDGQTYTIKVNYIYPTATATYNETEISMIKDRRLIVVLRAVSKDYYNYKKSLIIHQANQYSDFWDGIGQPVPMFGNIQNGYGIFAGYTTTTDTIK